MMKFIAMTCWILFFPNSIFAHAGPHGNNECLVAVGEIELRLNGYQFQGSKPDRHYCRHFPYLGETIIKIDSISADLSGMAIELQIVKRDSWIGLILNADDAFSVVKQKPLQYFSGPLKKGVVSIDTDIQSRDIYALKLRLRSAEGQITEQQFMFLVGVPFAQVMVAIAVLLLLFIFVIFLRQLFRSAH